MAIWSVVKHVADWHPVSLYGAGTRILRPTTVGSGGRSKVTLDPGHSVGARHSSIFDERLGECDERALGEGDH